MMMPMMIVFGIEASRGQLAAFATLCTCSCSYPCHRKTTSILHPTAKVVVVSFLTDRRTLLAAGAGADNPKRAGAGAGASAAWPPSYCVDEPTSKFGLFPYIQKEEEKHATCRVTLSPHPKNPFPPFASSLSSVSQPGQSLSCPRLWPVPCGAEQHLRN
jgi:hypothetical protein